jgi:hypothetical protein
MDDTLIVRGCSRGRGGHLVTYFHRMVCYIKRDIFQVFQMIRFYTSFKK